MVIVDRARVADALPRYELAEHLGSGAFGLVIAGRHRQLDRQVAIKVMMSSAEGGTNFGTEARLLASLDHPHIVRLHDYVEVEDLHLLVMELLAGGTLTKRRPGMSPQAACAVGLAVASALSYAHRRGVLHRDVKPDNIMFDEAGMVKVTDFGIAKIFDGTAATASAVVGTPLFMAPEQIAGGRLSPGTDIYALGIVLYQLLSGTPPFDPKQPISVLWQQHLSVVPPPPPGVPAVVADVISRALAKEPAHRQPSTHAFALELAAAATQVFGASWVTASEVSLRLDDEVRRLAEPPPTAPAPAAQRQSPVWPSPSPTPSPGPMRHAVGDDVTPNRILQTSDEFHGDGPTSTMSTATGAAATPPGQAFHPADDPHPAGPGQLGGTRRLRTVSVAAAVAALLAAVTGVVVALTASGGGDQPAEAGGDRPVVTLGFQGPLSGDNAQLGTNARDGVDTAIAEANADADLPFTLELVETDDQGDPAVAPTAAQELVDNADVVAVVGPVFSGATNASEPLFSAARLLSVSPSATNPDLTNPENGYDTFYRVIAPDTAQGGAVSEYIVSEFAPRAVYSLDDRSDYGIGLSSNIEENLSAAGVTVVHSDINPTDDYTAEATKIVSEDPGVLFYSGYYAELALLTKALRDKDFQGIIMSGDGSLDPRYIEQAGADVAEGVYLSCACGEANTDPAAAEFVASFKEVNDGANPGTYSGEAYDATNAMIEVMKGLGGDITRESLAGAFGSVEYQGITKLIKFEENGEVEGLSIFIYQVTDGAITVLGTTEDLVGS